MKKSIMAAAILLLTAGGCGSNAKTETKQTETQMETSVIPKIVNGGDSVPAGALALAVDQANWNDRFPYAPEVTVKLWHDGDNLYINSTVDEEYVRSMVEEDNGEVWNDSCVEFFITFGEDGYYNFETNCTGKMVVSHRLGKNEGVEFAGPEVLSKIGRESSLGTGPFDVKKAEGPWSMTVRLPKEAFFKHGFASLDGQEGRANIYKCGDALPSPHFLSWQKVEIPDPDFHRPEFFAPLTFAH